MHSKTVKFITLLRHTTQGRMTQHKQAKYPNIKLSASLNKTSSSCNLTANVRNDGRSFPRSNADVCTTDRQRRRRYSAAGNAAHAR